MKEDGESDRRDGFRKTLSCCDSPVSAITWLLGTLGEDVDPSVKQGKRESLSYLSIKHIFGHL